jgi:putative transposase
MSNARSYKWRAKYGGMDASMMSRMKDLEAKKNGLKKCIPKSDLKLKSSRKPWK